MLLSVDDWKRVLERPVGLPAGRPFVSIDLGHGRAWCSAVVIFDSGRVDAIALAPGIPSLEEQERRDRVPGGTYRALHHNGSLLVAEGLRVQPASQLLDAVFQKWGRPTGFIADRFRIDDLRDHAGAYPYQPG